MQKDVIIIGSGPGGYIAAIECAKRNRKVSLIEMGDIGGVCLNYGCMPTKALLHSAKEVLSVRNAKERSIISLDDFTINYPKIIQNSREKVLKLQDGVRFLMKKYNVEIINAKATFKSKNEVELEINNLENGNLDKNNLDKISGKGTITFNDAIIATGSTPRVLPNILVNGINVHNSKTFLVNEKMPKNVLIIGSGSIGLEFASFLNALGVNVIIVEALDKVMPQADATISNTLKRSLQNRGITIHTSSSISSFENKNNDIIDVVIKNKKDEEISFKVDMCLVSIGVVPNTKDLGLENANILLTERGFIKVNDDMQTSTANIYAIGDVIGLPTLAHVASREALIASASLCSSSNKCDSECDNKCSNENNTESKFNKNVIPYGTYSFPQVASVGLTEEQAKAQDLPYKSVRIPFSANGKAVVSDEDEGLIKLIYDTETKKILGCHIIQENAVELITEITLAINNDLTCDDIAKTIHAHPTLSEIIAEVSALF